MSKGTNLFEREVEKDLRKSEKLLLGYNKGRKIYMVGCGLEIW